MLPFATNHRLARHVTVLVIYLNLVWCFKKTVELCFTKLLVIQTIIEKERDAVSSNVQRKPKGTGNTVIQREGWRLEIKDEDR